MILSDKILGLLPYELADKVTIGDLPGTSENAICLTEYSGYTNTEYFGMKNDSTTYQPLIKFVVRNFSYETASTYVSEIKECLHKYVEKGVMYILLVGSPIYLGKSNQKLHEFQVTFKVSINE